MAVRYKAQLIIWEYAKSNKKKNNMETKATN